MDALIEKYQHIRFIESVANNQNGFTKRVIQTIIQMSHIMMIHSAIRSSQGTITAELWPMAIHHAVWLYNWMPHKDSVMSTYKLWSHYSFITSKDILSTWHTWGDPTYVL